MYDTRQMKLPFGRLLKDPYCTPKSTYAFDLIKSFIFLCRVDEKDEDLVAFYRESLDIFRTRLFKIGNIQINIEHPTLEKLLNKLLDIGGKSKIYPFCIPIIVHLVLMNRSFEKYAEFYLKSLDKCQENPSILLSVFRALEDIFSFQGKDFIQTVIPLAETRVSVNLFKAVAAIISSRFDDDFTACWDFMIAVQTRWLSKLSATDTSTYENELIAFLDLMEILYKVDGSERSCDFAVGLIEYFSSVQFSMPVTLAPKAASFLSAIFKGSDVSSQMWITSTFVSSIRRMSPSASRATHELSTQEIRAFIFLCKICFEMNIMAINPPLHEASLNFMRQFLNFKEIGKSLEIACFLIDYLMSPKIPFHDAIFKDILTEIVKGTETGSSGARNHEEVLEYLLGKLVNAAITPNTAGQVLFICSSTLSVKRDFTTTIRRRTLEFLSQFLSKNQSEKLMCELVHNNLYPIINSLVHARLSESSSTSIPFDFQCFVQESRETVLDLVALSSWIQIASGMVRGFPRFISIYSPFATWITYGKSLDHRRICFDIYLRWDRLSNGNFFFNHQDIMVTSMIQVLLDSHLDYCYTSMIAEFLRFKGYVFSKDDHVHMTKSLTEKHHQFSGILQFLPLGISEANPLEWAHYSKRLVAQLSHFRSRHVSGKVTMNQVLEGILNKEEEVRLGFGPMSSSDSYFLVQVLSLCPSINLLNKSHNFGISQIWKNLDSCSDGEFHQILQTFATRKDIATAFLAITVSMLDIIESISPRLERMICECIAWCGIGDNPLFDASALIPDSARPKYARFLLAAICGRVFIPQLGSWLKWVFAGSQIELEEVDIRLFEKRYYESCGGGNADFGMMGENCPFKDLQHSILIGLGRRIHSINNLINKISL